jgi:L-alanine-DL-glutamate epimerase-like enolase superfamily enzyme
VEFALEQVRKSGFRSFKLKSAAYSPQWDWKLLNELREALPAARIRFDPNANYGVATATELCRRLDPLGLEFFEDPTGELEGIARLKAAVKTPVATNMWVVKDEQLVPAIRRKAVDVVLGDLFMWGGIDALAPHGARRARLRPEARAAQRLRNRHRHRGQPAPRLCAPRSRVPQRLGIAFSFF